MPSEVKINKVPEQHIRTIWPLAQPWLTKGLSAAHDLSMSAVIRGLLDGYDQLWIVVDGKDVIGSFLTSVHQGDDDTPDRFLAVYALGGERAPEWAAALGDTITDYAKHKHCEAVRFVGRPGWGRLVPHVQPLSKANEREHIYERAVQ